MIIPKKEDPALVLAEQLALLHPVDEEPQELVRILLTAYSEGLGDVYHANESQLSIESSTGAKPQRTFELARDVSRDVMLWPHAERLLYTHGHGAGGAEA